MRCHWGWGDEQNRPTPEKIAPRATPFFGALTPEAAVPVEAAVLPKPRIDVPRWRRPPPGSRSEPREG